MKNLIDVEYVNVNVDDFDHCDPRAILEGGDVQHLDSDILMPDSSMSPPARDPPQKEMLNIITSEVISPT